MDSSRRQKKVGNLIKAELSRLFIKEIQDSSSGIITITRVEMSLDLKTAHVYLTIFRHEKKDEILAFLEKRKGYLRKSIASKIKLKYNPLLIFAADPASEYENNIDKLLEIIKINEKLHSSSYKK